MVQHQNVMTGDVADDEEVNLQNKTTKVLELEEFEAYKSFRTMIKL